MLVEYAVLELDPDPSPMFGQRWECCCVFGAVVEGAEGVVLVGVAPPLTADQATPAPIVSAARTTSATRNFIRTMAASFRSSSMEARQPEKTLRKGSDLPV